MVATRTDITEWDQLPLFEPFKEKMRVILRERPAIFVGLSGQDFNLQALWVTARIGGAAYPFDPPWVVFTVTAIDAPQRAVMQALYGQGVYSAHAEKIEDKSKLPLYAKPLLGGLYVILVLQKLSLLLDLGEDQFPAGPIRMLARSGIVSLKNLLTTRYDGIGDPSGRWRQLASELSYYVARVLRLYRQQQMPPTSEAYEPIDSNHLAEMALDGNLPAVNLHWLLLAITLFYEGCRVGDWSLFLSEEMSGEDGQLRVSLGGNEIAIFLVNRADSAFQKLEDNDVITVGSLRRSLLIYPSGRPPGTVRRSPSRTFPGGVIVSGPSEVWLEDLVTPTVTIDILLDMLRSAMISADPL
jgi:hypothetical protein